MSLPMIIVWFIAAAVTLIVTGAVYTHRSKGEPIGMALATVAGITFWVTGMTAGFFVTHFSSPTPETWWQALAVRVAWQIGGALFFGITIAIDALFLDKAFRKPGVWIFVGVCVALGTLAAFNPLMDLVEGPIVRSGAVELEVDRKPRVRGGAGIWAQMRITAADGTIHQVNTAGWAAEKMEELVERCADADQAEVTMLRRTKRVLDARCL